MADTSILFTQGPVKIDSIELDAAISLTHQSAVTITEHPVEDGANISDHSRPRPESIVIDGVISNTRLGLKQELRVVEAFGQRFQVAAGSTSPNAAGYAQEALVKLKELSTQRKTFTVVTRRRTYTDMMIETLSSPEDKNTGDSLRFTATCRQVIIVRNKVTRRVVAKEPKAQPKIKAGKQTPKEADPAKVSKSILTHLDDSTGGGLFKLLSPSGT